MKGTWATVELAIGILTGVASLFMFSSLAAISAPQWGAKFVIFWGALFVGPLLLVVGALATLLNIALKPAALLTLVGSVVLCCWALYSISSIPAERARGALTSRDLILVGSLLLVALVSNLAAYRLYKLAVPRPSLNR